MPIINHFGKLDHAGGNIAGADKRDWMIVMCWHRRGLIVGQDRDDWRAFGDAAAGMKAG